MKRILTIMAAALRLAAQGAGENYIKSVTYTDSAGTSARREAFLPGRDADSAHSSVASRHHCCTRLPVALPLTW